MLQQSYRILLGLACACDILVIDLLSKYFLFEPGIAFSFFGGFIKHVIHQNSGLIANLPLPQPIIIVMTFCFLMVFIFWWFTCLSRSPLVTQISAGMVLGGALGNVVDRVMLGFVRDWILVFDRSAMNIADIAIVLGTISLFFFVRSMPARENDVQGKNPPA